MLEELLSQKNQCLGCRTVMEPERTLSTKHLASSLPSDRLVELSSVCCPARCTEDEISLKTHCSKIFPLPYTKWATTHIPLCLHLSVFQLFYYAICVFVESNYIYALPSTKKEAAGKSWQSWLKSPFCPSVEQQQTSDKKWNSISLGRLLQI